VRYAPAVRRRRAIRPPGAVGPSHDLLVSTVSDLARFCDGTGGIDGVWLFRSIAGTVLEGPNERDEEAGEDDHRKDEVKAGRRGGAADDERGTESDLDRKEDDRTADEPGHAAPDIDLPGQPGRDDEEGGHEGATR